MKNKIILFGFMSAFLALSINANPVNPQPGENIWHLIAGVGTEVDLLAFNQSAQDSVIESKLDGCCISLGAQLDEVNAQLQAISGSSIDSLVGTFTQLISLSDELIVSLTTLEQIAFTITSTLAQLETLLEGVIEVELTTQSKLDLCCATLNSKVDLLAACAASPIIGGTTISISGNYCLTQSFTGNIVIDAPSTILDLNGREVTGLIQVNQPYSVIKNGTLFGPPATTTQQSRVGTITMAASNTTVLNCTIIGLPGQAAPLIHGRNGINDDFVNNDPITRDNCVIKNCIITGGAGFSSPTAFTGSGGDGVFITGNNDIITDCLISGGVGGSSAMNQAGSGGNGFRSQAPGNASNMFISNSTFIGGDSGTGLLGSGGGDGMSIPQLTFIVSNCKISGGNGLNASQGPGSNGGVGLALGNTNLTSGLVENTKITGGNGGNSGNNSVTLDAGGHGADAVTVVGKSNNTKLRNCSILSAGNGGNGFNAGDGGHGIYISSSNNIGTEITKCVICQSGKAGVANGGTAGIPGRAIFDQTTTFSAFIFSNFAYDIADTSTRYVIRNSGTVVESNGISAYSTSPLPTFLDNIFVP
jgi:hypothetical protein